MPKLFEPMTDADIERLKGLNIETLTGEDLARAAYTAAIESLTDERIDGLLGSKLETTKEELNAELTRRILEELPTQKAWAADNLVTRDEKTGITYSRPQAIKALHFEDSDKAMRALMGGGVGQNQHVETIIGDLLDKERKFFEDNDLLDVPCGKHMAKLHITPRWIFDVRKRSGIFQAAPVKLMERGTLVVGSGAGSYLTWVQYLAEVIDYLFEEDQFFAQARHIPVETGSIKLPRNYRSTARKILGTVDVKSESSAPSTEGTKYSDRLEFTLNTIAGYITTSDEILAENMVGVRQMVEQDLKRDLAEKIAYFSMVGSGSSQPLGLWKTKVGSTGTTALHSVIGNHDAQWDDIRAAAKVLGGEYMTWFKNAKIVCAKSAYFDFDTRKDAFNNYIMKNANVIDTFPYIPANDATVQQAALTPPETYWFAENFALTTMAMAYKEGKALITEGDLLFYIGVRYDSKHMHHKITSDNPDDAALVLITGLQA